LSRQTITTVAPKLANPIAVNLPIPEFAPVTRHIFPFKVKLPLRRLKLIVSLSELTASEI
jgi:hypothetical protein